MPTRPIIEDSDGDEEALSVEVSPAKNLAVAQTDIANTDGVPVLSASQRIGTESTGT